MNHGCIIYFSYNQINLNHLLLTLTNMFGEENQLFFYFETKSQLPSCMETFVLIFR